ncbi:MAG TPA: CRTAC1 family protein, partial [Acidobacteriaceae bacterium]
MHGYSLLFGAPEISDRDLPLHVSDVRLVPHYPKQSALEEVLRLVPPGSDQYVTEGYAFSIQTALDRWSDALRASARDHATLAAMLDPAIHAASLESADTTLRDSQGLQIVRRSFTGGTAAGRDGFLRGMDRWLADLTRIEVAEFQITALEQTSTAPLKAHLEIRYDLVCVRADQTREERVGVWRTEWTRDSAAGWKANRWEAVGETVSRAHGGFADVSRHALGGIDSYERQMLHGSDYWRTVLDGACGVDVYGNNGIAAGDFDNDGFDDLYVCQPAGLPNRLYRNRGDGAFEDVTDKAGVGVLDNTACALFADFRNKGLQDLLVVCGSGPLLFLNQGDGTFAIKRDAFQFARVPEGTFTHAAIADYDRDGRLDIYFCLYSYYLGLDQYHYPVPYFDARNGPANFLLHNEGDGRFVDRTQAAGLNAENDRYSFACAWGSSGPGGLPDLYVANDFGRGNLYRNNGNGTFTAASSQAQVQKAGAGMSAAWSDFDNDGHQDIYAANMWSAAGQRVAGQKMFHQKAGEEIRNLYRRHACGNSLYRNLGNGSFEEIGERAGVAMGRWSWSSDFWDFDHDGYPDLYVANGYVSAPDKSGDLASFFWRQVVGKSPDDATPTPAYEHGWQALNELIRSDRSWNGYERNVMFANNRDGTFAEVSGAVGLDFAEDGRSFALADIDHDGRLEVVLRNRNAPQLRILHNNMPELGHSIAFRLSGKQSNRDGIGAAVTVEAGELRQTKYLQAGSGFLSQHSKELFFGLGTHEGTVRA